MYRYFILLALVASTASIITRKSRMIGGEPAKIEDFPWQVFVGGFVNRTIQVCGGVILSKHYVLTAAHCILEPRDKLFVKAGSIYLFTKEEHSSFHRIETVAIHENFTYYSRYEFDVPTYDIAVIRMQEPFRYDSHRQPIKLPKTGQRPEVNTTGKLAGWGETEDGFDEELRKLDFAVMEAKACNDSYKPWGGIRLEGVICVGTDDPFKKNGRGGDSGSPYVSGRRAWGVLSYGGADGAIEDAPEVLTDLGYFRGWIDERVVYDEDAEKEEKKRKKNMRKYQYDIINNE